jgi:hypothetical protein
VSDGLREALVAAAREKPVPPYTLDEELTFFCPQENLEALDLPTVRAFHEWVLREHRPTGRGAERTVLLLLPCQKIKPYTLSAEHLAVNCALLATGFRPEGRGDWPEGLARVAEPALLANTALVRGGTRIDRAVISEPFGLVPYEAIYRWQGQPSPAARYDDPGLFEHRGLACPWRADSTAHQAPDGTWRWGDAERAAFVEVHNRLAEHLTRVLDGLRRHYDEIIGYVGARLTHRTFLGDRRERRAAGLPSARRGRGCMLVLHGVGDAHPGLVRLVPDGAELGDLRRARGGQLPASLLTQPGCLDLLIARLAGRERATVHSDHSTD